MTEPVVLPEGQQVFKLNEVCKLANVQPYMLRFWGTEFPQLDAQKTGTGQRVYSRVQVELILEVRRLLFDEGLTVPGAKRRLAAVERPVPAPRPPRPPARVATKALQPIEEAPVAPQLPLALAPQPGPVPTPEPAPAPAAAPASSAAEVDKAARERVQPLLATLRGVREELAQIVASLEAGK